MQKLFIFIIVQLFLCFHGISQHVSIKALDGNWEFRRAGTKVWLPAKVPGSVHLDLLRNGLIKDPFYRDHETSLQWISEIGWEYKKEFRLDEKAFASRHIELVCPGLDTYANVYINDSLILIADNMFREWSRDIKPLLYIGNNVIRIQFPSVTAENKARYEKLKYNLPGDEKVVCRKAAYHFGWDWSPALITSGIWKSIYLRSWSQIKVSGVQFYQKNLTEELAGLTAEFCLTSELADSAYVRIYTGDGHSFQKAAIVRKGINFINLDFDIPDPRLWWPNGLGTPYLYTFSYEVRFAGRMIEEGKKRFGIRNISLVQQPDSAGRSFYFKVNGQDVFIKGANYIPQDNFLTRVSDSSYRKIIRDAKSAHINMLRVWGGGIYEKDIFYDLCDENGIMVWQDFMFACAMYPVDKDFIRNALSEVAENIYRLRNHPCLALWCGNNEIDEGWKNWGWQKQYHYSPMDSTEIYDNYRFLFNFKIPELIKKYDSTRPYIPSSPQTGWGHEESLRKGDVHYWGVWWGKKPFSIYTKKVGRFVSEYGFQGFPDLSTINRFTQTEDRQLGTNVMKVHQKHSEGYEIIDEYLQRDFRKPKNFNSYILVSQLLQSDGIQTAIEAHRRAKPYCMGTLFWQLNDCWPAVSWSAIDYYGIKKAVYYRIKNAFEAILPSPVIDNGRLKLYVVSDSPEKKSADLSLKIIDFDGKVFFKKNLHIGIPANSSQVFFEAATSELLTGTDSSKVVFIASIIDENGREARNLLYFSSPKNLKLPVPVIEKKMEKAVNGYRILLKTDKLAKGVYLSVPLKGEFSDNYFDMLPGESKEIFFETTQTGKDILPVLSVISLYDTYSKNEK